MLIYFIEIFIYLNSFISIYENSKALCLLLLSLFWLKSPMFAIFLFPLHASKWIWICMCKWILIKRLLLAKGNAFFLVLKDKLDNLLQIWMHRWRVWERFVILSKKWFYLTHITCSYLFKAMLTHNLCITRISHAYVFLLFVTYNLIHFAGEQGWKRENSLGQCLFFRIWIST
jgi:hypothetical protein